LNDFEHFNERLEEEITILEWDGVNLQFRRGGQLYQGQVSGRRITGSFSDGEQTYSWSGAQAEVLTYGLAAKTAAERDEWQALTRRRLLRLLMDGAPAPTRVSLVAKEENLAPRPAVMLPNERDDNPQAWAQGYTLTRYELSFELPNPFGGAPLKRVANAYLALPAGLQFTGEKLPLVIALNGHGGDAWEVFNPESCFFWYGDAYARRGYAVLAVDIPHRAVADRIYFPGANPGEALGYPVNEGDYDDPAPFRVAPSLKPAREELAAAGVPESEQNLYTNWEEDGERAWTVLRVLDWLLNDSGVRFDPARMLVTGISLGGELTAFVAALDPRIAVAVPAGYSPDLSVLKYKNSHGCWNWSFAEIREYLDSSDLFALIAPRPLIIQTGALDTVYSDYSLLDGAAALELLQDGSPDSLRQFALNLRPFAGDKQIARRVRAAYAGELGNFLHYLHYDWHFYHFGDLNPNSDPDPLNGGCTAGPGIVEAISRPSQTGLTTPVQTGPEAGASWQTDPGTNNTGRTLFDHLEAFLGLTRASGL
jgi:dienelactone hydrolase